MLVALILFGGAVLIIWIKISPEQARIVIDKILVGIFMTVFFWVGWVFMKMGKNKQMPNPEIHEPKEEERSDS